MKEQDINKMKEDFSCLQKWVQERIIHYTTSHRPPYSQAALAKEIGVGAKTVLFGSELSDNMSWRKWMELAEGIVNMEKRG